MATSKISTNVHEASRRQIADFSVSNLLLTLPFLVLFYLQLAHHELWRDEINAWGLVCASPTLRLLLANVHYEAHPALWYLLLYPASKVSHAPGMMKVVQGIIGTGIYLVLGVLSPFRRFEKVLIFLSYFVLFEYTVMSRMYGVGFLFALLYVWQRMRRPDKMVGSAVLLGLMANSDTLYILLSGGLLLEFGIDSYQRHKATGLPGVAEFWKAGAAYVALCAISVATLWPAKEISWRTTGHVFMYARNGHHVEFSVLSYLVLPWFPENLSFPQHFWNPEVQAQPMFYLVLLPFTFGLLCWAFKSSPRLLLMLASIALAGMLFGHLVYLGSMRHFGIVFIGFLVAFWILRSRREWVSPGVYVLLGLSAAGGLEPLYGQWSHPFTDAAAATQWIEENHYQDATLIGWPDTHVVGLPERLQRPMYLLDCSCVDKYMKFANRRDHFDPDTQLLERVAKAVTDLHAPVMILAVNKAFTEVQTQELMQDGVSAEPLASFTQGEVVDEHFYLYRLKSAAER